MMLEWDGVLPTLVGFENEEEYGTGTRFNFILSNGTRSTQREENWPTSHSHMIPKDALKKIRSVNIHYYNDSIRGFSFFDKDGSLI